MMHILPDRSERKLFSSVLEKLELVLAMRKYSESRRLLSDYSVLNPNTCPHEFEHISEEKKAMRENRFLIAVRETLLKANFIPISNEELEWALREDYLSTLPVDINWEGLDPEPFRRYQKMHDSKENVEHLAPNSDKAGRSFIPSNRVWVFRRGLGVDEMKGYFLLEKLDHLLILLLTRFMEMAPGLLHSFPILTRFKLWQVSSQHSAKGMKKTTTKKRGLNAAATGLRTLSPDAPEDLGSNVITRHTLHDEVRTQGVSSLIRKSTIKEPVYKEVIVMYKRNPRHSVATNDPTETPASNESGIVLRAYRSIPMADLEMVFPEKKLGVRPLDFVYLVATALTGLATLVLHFSEEVSSWFGLAALIGFVTLAARTFITYRYNIIYYQRLILGFVNDKATASDREVLLYMVDKFKLQELKETAVLYFFLWIYGQQSIPEIMKVCESFMLDIQRFDKRPTYVRFAVHDALYRLVKLGLAMRADGLMQDTIDDDAFYQVAPPDKAIAQLREQWANTFSNHKQTQDGVPSLHTSTSVSAH